MNQVTEQDREDYLLKRLSLIDTYISCAGNIQYYLHLIEQTTREKDVSLSSVFENNVVCRDFNHLMNNPFLIYSPVREFIEIWQYNAYQLNDLETDIKFDKINKYYMQHMFENCLSKSGNQELLSLANCIDHKRFPTEFKKIVEDLRNSITDFYKKAFSAEITTLPIKSDYIYAYGLKSINPITKSGECGIYRPVLIYRNLPIPLSQLPDEAQIKEAQNLYGARFSEIAQDSTYEHAHGKGKD